MDIATLSAAYTGIKAIKDILGSFVDAKVDAKAKERVAEALDKLGSVQGTLFSLREELSRLQSENTELRERLAQKEDWKNTKARYELVETSGSAVVYRAREEPEHFICPSCFAKREVQILQDQRVWQGFFVCPGCDKKFPVKERLQAAEAARDPVRSSRVRFKR